MRKLCELFAETLVWLDAHVTHALWSSFAGLMAEHHRHVCANTIHRTIQEHLALFSKSLVDVGIDPPSPDADLTPMERARNEYAQEL